MVEGLLVASGRSSCASRWYRGAAACVVLVLGMGAGVAGAEIYRWTDQAGRIHFTQDLSQVPGRYRVAAEARANAPKGRDPIQVYHQSSTSDRTAGPPAALGPTGRVRRVTSRTGAGGTTYRIPVQKAGTSLRVMVQLNDRVSAPFIIDTGATDVVIPRAVADELRVRPGTGRTKVYSTANGIITQQTLVLDSVSLGGARVESVTASVSPSMNIGLLGLSYFNNFNYQIDPVNGVVVLKRNKLAESGMLRAGRSEANWRSEFLSMQARLDYAEEALDDVPNSRARRRETYREQLAELHRQYRVLEDEADDAHVPFAWRY